MEKMIDLKDLLKHEVLDLYSAEEQIIAAMPAMIEKAQDGRLKKSLQEHLKVTEKQKARLDKVKNLLSENENEESNGNGSGKGFFSSLFGGSGSSQKCKGMEGLITEGEKVMGEDMTPEVLDAAIIASAQKIEHYEICGYGTARAYARQLNLGQVAELLEETLDEEYEADDRLTDLAVGGLNEEAEEAEEGGSGTTTRRRSSGRSNSGRSNSGGGRKAPSKKAAAKGGRNASIAKKTPGKRSSGSKSKTSKSSGRSKTGSRKGSNSRGR